MANNRQFGQDRCTTCRRPDVLEINAKIARGVPLQAVAVEYGIRRATLHVHWHNHVLTDEFDQGAIAIGWHDVVTIPLAMRERRLMQDAVISRAMEFLTRGPGPSAFTDFPGQLLVAIWKLQMMDEQTILKVAGVLKEPHVSNNGQLPAADQVRELREKMEATIREFSQGDWAKEADLRLAIAQAIDPRDDLPEPLDQVDFSMYTDLGADEYTDLP